MNLLKKLATLFAATGQGRGIYLYDVSAQCNRCGEIVHAQINLNNDLSVEYDEAGNISGYVCRKVMLGKQRCFQPIEVTLTFDPKHKLVERKIENGKWVQAE